MITAERLDQIYRCNHPLYYREVKNNEPGEPRCFACDEPVTQADKEYPETD